MSIITLKCFFLFSKNRMRKLTCALIILLVLSGCSDKNAEHSRNTSSTLAGGAKSTESPASLTTGPYALEISPATASRNSTVNLIFTGFAASDAKIEWLLNGEPEESDSPNQFTLSQSRKGDTLQARAIIRDREVLSNKIEIVNAPPEITSAALLTDIVKPGDGLGIAVTGSDADGDDVSFLYEWSINGRPAGTGERIEGSVKRGDSVVVKVTPYDGESYGRSIVVERKIQNLPPLIQQHENFHFDGTVYTYQVKASDPDDDPLTYSIESPAEGMSIDKTSGLMTWNVPSEFKGRKSVSIVVADGHGGSAKYVLNISIQ
jgi:hypothetical protein